MKDIRSLICWIVAVAGLVLGMAVARGDIVYATDFVDVTTSGVANPGMGDQVVIAPGGGTTTFILVFPRQEGTSGELRFTISGPTGLVEVNALEFYDGLGPSGYSDYSLLNTPIFDGVNVFPFLGFTGETVVLELFGPSGYTFEGATLNVLGLVGPEPGTWALFALGIGGLAVAIARRKKKPQR